MATDFLEPGKFYLFACPWDWTFVGRYIQHADGRKKLEVSDCIYFTRTGATFGKLSTEGLVTGANGSLIHGGPRFIPNDGPVWAWTAATPWVKGEKK